MTLSREAMLELMAYADGELDADAHARVEALIASNHEARVVVESMGMLGDAVRSVRDAYAPTNAIADSIADDVMAKIEAAQSAGAGEMHELVSLAERRAAKRTQITMAAAAVFALAAGVVLFLHTNGSGTGPVADESPHEIAPVVQPAPRTAPGTSSTGSPRSPSDLPGALANAATEVDLEEIESAEHRVSVFYVPKAANAVSAGGSTSSVVIWIDDHAAGGH